MKIGKQLQKEYVIDGEIVEEVNKFCGITVYAPIEEHDSCQTLYFVKNDNVVQTLKIEADCNQNIGYISELTWGEE